MTVLLEEQPLQHLRMLELAVRQQRRTVGQIMQDGVGLDEKHAISKFQHRHLAVGILRQKLRRARFLFEQINGYPLMFDIQLVHQQLQFVAVAGIHIAIHSQHVSSRKLSVGASGAHQNSKIGQ